MSTKTSWKLVGKEVDAIEIEGTHVSGDVDARGAKIGRIRIVRATIEGALLLDEARVAGDIELEECRIEGGIQARHLILQGRLRAGSAVQITGDVRLSGARLDDQVDLGGAIIEGDLALDEAELASGLELQQVMVNGDLRLDDAEVGGWLDAAHAHVDGVISAPRAAFASGLELRGAMACGGLVLERATIGADLSLRGFRAGGRVTLACATLGGAVDLVRVGIDAELTLEGARAKGAVRLDDGHVHGRALLGGVEAAEVRLDDARLDAGGDLTGARIARALGLSGVRGEPVRFRYADVADRLAGDLLRDPVRGAAEYHLLRAWLERREEREEADDAYRRARAFERAHRGGRARAALEWALADLVSAYGTSPLRVAAAAAAVVLLCAALIGSPLESLRAFAGIEPDAASVAVVEGYVGFFLMALFVGTITRKLAR